MFSSCLAFWPKSPCPQNFGVVYKKKSVFEFACSKYSCTLPHNISGWQSYYMEFITGLLSNTDIWSKSIYITTINIRFSVRSFVTLFKTVGGVYGIWCIFWNTYPDPSIMHQTLSHTTWPSPSIVKINPTWKIKICHISKYH